MGFLLAPFHILNWDYGYMKHALSFLLPNTYSSWTVQKMCGLDLSVFLH
jgi:hypothetical protein